jgi:hypothetical protein
MIDIPKVALTSASAGGAVWLASLFFQTSDSFETELIKRIFLLGIFVIVPLGLSLVATTDRGRHSILYSLAVVTQPIGAVASCISFYLRPGLTAALLASTWLFVNTLIAFFGMWRFWRRGVYPAEEACVDVGLLYLPVGGIWFVMSRLGIQPFGFGDTIVLLTAVHFHFAGFAAPILAGMAGRLLNAQKRPPALFPLAVIGIIGGTPLVAAGITFSPALALIGALVISIGLTLLAGLVIGSLLRKVEPTTGRILLGISSLSSFSAMVLACLYAYSIVAKKLIIDIPQMAMTHGLLNAFGFATCGLIAWSIIKPQTRVRASVPGSLREHSPGNRV